MWHVWRRAYTGFCWGNLRERDNIEDPGVDGRIILRWIFRKWDVWARTLAQDRDRWRVLINFVMNLRVPSNEGNFLISCEPVSFSRRTLLHGVSKEVSQSVSKCVRNYLTMTFTKWSCLETRIQNKVTMQILIVVPF